MWYLHNSSATGLLGLSDAGLVLPLAASVPLLRWLGHAQTPFFSGPGCPCHWDKAPVRHPLRGQLSPPPPGSRRHRTAAGRTGDRTNTRARPRGAPGWARRRDVTSPGRARRTHAHRTHAHCAQHEGRGSDQVTRRRCHLPPPLPAFSPLSADEREVPLALAAERGCMCWRRVSGPWRLPPKGRGGALGLLPSLAGPVVLGSRSYFGLVAASAPLALKLGFTLDSLGGLQKLLVSGCHRQERCSK